MAKTTLSKIDEYGFERPESFDFKTYESFMSDYLSVLARRSKRWANLTERDKFKRSSLMKRFIRKGVPSDQRGHMWMFFAVGKTVQKPSYSELKKNISNQNIIDIIEIDLPRTFPDNIFFQQDQTLPRKLYNILATFAHQNNDVGYCQGLNYIAGLLLLATKSEEYSFWILKALIESILPQYYIKSMSGLIIDLEVLDDLVKSLEPQIHSHIKKIGMPWAVGSTKWFICLYAEVLPTETVLRIWDCLIYEGSKVLFRVALTLIRMHKQQILEAYDLADLVTCFRNMGNHPQVVNCHVFIKNIYKMPGSLSSKTIEKLRRKHGSTG